VTAKARRRLFHVGVSSLLLWVLAAGSYGLLRVAFGQRPVSIHVRWAPSVDNSTRERLEQRHGLSRGEQSEGRTWAYELTDRSRANIRALVTDPAVEDTQNLHRTAFRVGYFAPRGRYAAGTPPVVLEFLTVLFLIAGFVAIVFDPIAASGELARWLISWIRGRIPPASAEAVGVFRIVFGCGLLAIFLFTPFDATWASDPANPTSTPQRLALRLFTEHPWITGWIKPWLLFWGLLFVAGALARVSFVFLTAGALLWSALYTTRIVSHTVSAFLVTLVCLTWSRWGDAWSVDARRRRNRPLQPAAPHEYGYTIWLPGLVLGVVLAAAAAAKLRESGLAWILNGTVKYHFLSDSLQAPFTWGLQVGRHPWLAVALSFAAVAVESLVIVGVLARAYRYRVAAGTAALLLLLGFWSLQGLFWPGWWILLLSFLPWHRIEAATVAIPVSRARMVCPAIILIVIAQQIVVSTLRLEVPPVMSTYDMYATTYSSAEEYERSSGVSYWIVGIDDKSEPHDCSVGAGDADVIVKAATSPGDRVAAQRVLDRCFPPALPIRSVSVESRQVKVNWDEWELESDTRARLAGPVPVDAIR
jgi:hypothetical protein